MDPFSCTATCNAQGASGSPMQSCPTISGQSSTCNPFNGTDSASSLEVGYCLYQ